MAYDKTFTQLTDISNDQEFEACVFEGIDMTSFDFNTKSFMECQFINCNLSNVKVNDTAFKSVHFDNCKLLGIDFSICHPFLLEMSFEFCQMDFSIFYQLKLNKTKFIQCHMHAVDLTETQLESADFTNSDLLDTVFESTNLKKADFRGAENYRIHPVNNQIKGALFSKDGLMGLLMDFGIKVK